MLLAPLLANGCQQCDQPMRGRTSRLADRAGSMGARCIYHPHRAWEAQGQHVARGQQLSRLNRDALLDFSESLLPGDLFSVWRPYARLRAQSSEGKLSAQLMKMKKKQISLLIKLTDS